MKILHLDYSSFFRKVIQDMILSQGHVYSGASSIGPGLELLSKDDYDVIFTGLELTDGSAEDLFKELAHSNYENIPVVIITSSEIKDITHRLKQLTFEDIILKDTLTSETLKRCLNRLK